MFRIDIFALREKFGQKLGKKTFFSKVKYRYRIFSKIAEFFLLGRKTYLEPGNSANG